MCRDEILNIQHADGVTQAVEQNKKRRKLPADPVRSVRMLEFKNNLPRTYLGERERRSIDEIAAEPIRVSKLSDRHRTVSTWASIPAS